jgi:hypothetical protein
LPHAAKVESQNGRPGTPGRTSQAKSDLVMERSPMQRVWMANHDGSLDAHAFIGTFVERFETPGRSLHESRLE